MKPKVLVIDPSPDVHVLLRARLHHEDLELRCADDGAAGLAIARELAPDLVLLEVEMPGMGGFDVLRRLKEDGRTIGIPVVFLTSQSAVDIKVTAFDLGAVDYVTKPFEPSELRARVRAALRTKRYQDLLASRASVDALTTLWNRAHFERRVVEEVSNAIRHGRPLSLLMLDVDHFKRLNDTHGHPMGDKVLQAIGERLWELVRAADVPCRYGGEEFAILLTETRAHEGRAVAERVRAEIAAMRFELRGRVVQATASIGVAGIEDQPEPTRDALVGSADRALYAAKSAGRNRVYLWTPWDTAVSTPAPAPDAARRPPA